MKRPGVDDRALEKTVNETQQHSKLKPCAVSNDTKARSQERGQAEAGRKTYRVPVDTALFEHFHEIRDSVWALIWYTDKVTKEVPDGKGSIEGIVLGGRPIRDEELADAFGCSRKTSRRWRQRLTKFGFIRTRRTPNGFVIFVANCKKWPNRAPVAKPSGVDKNVHSEVPIRDNRSPALGQQKSQSWTCNKTNQYKTPTEQEAAFDSRSSFEVSTLRTKIFELYKERFGKNPQFDERQGRGCLLGLLRSYDNDVQLLGEAFEAYVRDRDDWLAENAHPLGYFFKHARKYVEQALNEEHVDLFYNTYLDLAEERGELTASEKQAKAILDAKRAACEAKCRKYLGPSSEGDEVAEHDDLRVEDIRA
jgi:hypothetical protein